ncbi:uncharacterized protein LOC112670848 [Canis lupus dingo]|uniref:uncharacterized protein LOC112670848 n=1 Tax=Canis lupus dingo TaxID=286419 RepID=UPI000DC678C5|nr:uncharacterized protein LOC112670848 [Canis lupus dingo]
MFQTIMVSGSGLVMVQDHHFDTKEDVNLHPCKSEDTTKVTFPRWMGQLPTVNGNLPNRQGSRPHAPSSGPGAQSPVLPPASPCHRRPPSRGISQARKEALPASEAWCEGATPEVPSRALGGHASGRRHVCARGPPRCSAQAPTLLLSLGLAEGLRSRAAARTSRTYLRPPSGRPSAPPARTVEVLGSKTIAPILPGFRTVEGRGGGGPCVTCVTLRGPPGSARMRGFEVRGCERKEQPNSRGAVAPQQTSTLPQELRVCSFCNAFRL